MSESASQSVSVGATGSLKLRAKIWDEGSPSPSRNPVWEVDGEVVDATLGTARFVLPESLVEQSGIYELSFVVLNTAEKPVYTDRGLLSVERSLWAADLQTNRKALGPPGIQEIRMRMMDSSVNENILLANVEFSDEQLLLALAAPVRIWTETPPPIRTYNTRTFPFREHWLIGVLGQLHLIAANHYRRNTMRGAAGGTSDKDKEREYMAEGMRLMDEYKAWMHNKKTEINLRLFAGQSVSAYSYRSSW